MKTKLTAILLLSFIQAMFSQNSLNAQSESPIASQNSLQDTLVLNSSVISASSPQERLREVQIGIEKIGITEMAKMPAFMGERDVIKALQLLHGVKEASQGSSGFQVRGGTTSQNLILLDGAPVYNAGHLMGLFSTFNDDALMDATLYKGLIPASFGGATSSVFDISTRPGSFSLNKRLEGTASIGLLSTKFSVGGPVKDGKSSFYISARRTYFDLFLKLTKNYKNTILNFYDLNARYDYSLGESDRLSFSVFSARDKMSIDDLMTMEWGNKTATLRWSHSYSDNLRSNVYAYASAYDSDNDVDILEQTLTYTGFIHQGGISAKWIWTPTSNTTIDFGVQPNLYWVCTGEWEYNGFPNSERRNALEIASWINGQWKLSPSFTLSAGVRYGMFSSLGGHPFYDLDEDGNILKVYDYGKLHLVKPRLTVEPRVSLNWLVASNLSIKSGYTRSTQNIHALKNDGLSLPFDRYIISSNIIKPQISDQVSLGLATMTANGDYDFSIEGYYKAIQNVLDYKEGKYLSSEIELERIVKSGNGRAYGFEFSARKNTGKITGWVSYTLSWAENKIDGVNHGLWYTAANDRRHDFTIVGMYDLSGGWDASATWSYNTGQAMSAPSAKYKVEGTTWYYYAEKNGYRAPANHHLDLSLTHTKTKKYGERQWVFSVYNAYDRKNPYIIMFTDDETKPSGTKTTMYSLFGIVPSVSYNIKF